MFVCERFNPLWACYLLKEILTDFFGIRAHCCMPASPQLAAAFTLSLCKKNKKKKKTQHALFGQKLCQKKLIEQKDCLVFLCFRFWRQHTSRLLPAAYYCLALLLLLPLVANEDTINFLFGVCCLLADDLSCFLRFFAKSFCKFK